MTFKIVSDSSSDVLELSGVDYASVPLKIITEDKEYVDTAELDVEKMADDLKKYKGTSKSSCPNMDDWYRAFGDSDCVFCVAITKNLSGSHNSATLAAQDYMEDHPERKVFCVDGLSAGPENALLIEKLRDLILSGLSFEEICNAICEYKRSTHLLFALESMRNLANNGRISHAKAKIAGLLGIRAVGKASLEGTLEMLSKVRGADGTVAESYGYMKQNGYCGGKVRIHHCKNPEIAENIKKMILADFPEASVVISSTRALCSFYAEAGGFLIGYEGNNKY